MKCETIEQALIESAGMTPEIVAHLEGCAACRSFQATLMALERSLDPDGVPDPGPRYWSDLPGRVRIRLAQERVTRTLWERILDLPRFVSLVPVALLLLLLLLRPGIVRWQGEDTVAVQDAPSEAEIVTFLEEEEGAKRLFSVVDLEEVDPARLSTGMLLAINEEIQGGDDSLLLSTSTGLFDDTSLSGTLDELEGEELEALAAMLERS
ncbi:MAG: hypothetical protein D6795_17915 [Deltaproteobacteria bacterium]|nr:MAG: hypothetical protein D6795_17915 [Deltaproteobacteria bacterium]